MSSFEHTDIEDRGVGALALHNAEAANMESGHTIERST